METLSPLVTLAPGEAVMHLEKWWLYKSAEEVRTEEDAARVVSANAPR